MKAYRAEGALDRRDFGMTWNAPLDTGAKYLGERVRLLLQVEVVQR
jgi:polyisoprenoid-binding protein YceI